MAGQKAHAAGLSVYALRMEDRQHVAIPGDQAYLRRQKGGFYVNRGWKTGSPADHERRIQAKIKQLLKLHHCAIWDTSQYFRAAITAGLPDLVVFCPKRGLFFVEVKARDGRQSKAQRGFQERCEQAGVPYILGGLEVVAAWVNGTVG
jgi:hypothetical protein